MVIQPVLLPRSSQKKAIKKKKNDFQLSGKLNYPKVREKAERSRWHPGGMALGQHCQNSEQTQPLLFPFHQTKTPSTEGADKIAREEWSVQDREDNPQALSAT